MTSDSWTSLAIIAASAGMGLIAWRWWIPYNGSFHTMVTGRPPQPGSWIYRQLQVGRWFMVVFCAFIFVATLISWISGS